MPSPDSGAALKAGFLLGAKSPQRKKATKDAVTLDTATGEAKDVPSIDELLKRPDAELTQWALEQAESVVDPHADVEKLEVFKYARAFAVATDKQRQELMDKGLEGFKKLPATLKGKALRFFMKHGDIMEVLLEAVKKADAVKKPEVRESRSPHVQEPQKKRADLVASDPSEKTPPSPCAKVAAAAEQPPAESADTDSASEKRPREKDIAARRETSDGLQRGFLLKEKRCAAAVQNIRRVAEEAGFDKRPLAATERATVREKAPALLQPGAVLDAVGELSEAERADLAETLIRTSVVPAIRRGDLLAAMRPGGFTDKLKLSLKIAGFLHRYAWLAIALCAVESFPFPGRELPCAAYLELWLRMDSLLWMAAVIAALAACKALTPMAKVWSENAVGTAFRFRETMTKTESWKERLATVFPGVEFDSFKAGALRAFIAFMLLFLACGWAMCGFALCVWSALTHRFEGVSVWVGVMFAVFRVASTVALVAPTVVFRRWVRLRYAEQSDEDPEKGKKKKKDE